LTQKVNFCTKTHKIIFFAYFPLHDHHCHFCLPLFYLFSIFNCIFHLFLIPFHFVTSQPRNLLFLHKFNFAQFNFPSQKIISLLITKLLVISHFFISFYPFLSIFPIFITNKKIKLVPPHHSSFLSQFEPKMF
jgi:hypothetical protein